MPREGIMLAYPFEEKRLASWHPPYIVQPKLDGLRCRAILTGMEGEEAWLLLSSQLNEFLSVPHVSRALSDQLKVPHEFELDGELYTHGLPFEEISSIASRTVNLHQDHQQLEYYIFDIVTTSPQYIRLLELRRLGTELRPPLHIVETEICNTLDDVLRAYDNFIMMGYEGIIVRHFEAPYQRKRVTTMMKFKPKKSDFYRITGFKEEISIEGIPKGRLGAFQCCPLDSNSVDDLFWVGTGMKEHERIDLWKIRDQLVGKLIRVGYQHITTSKHVPRFPVFLNIVEEM